jgi:hypothetical protein
VENYGKVCARSLGFEAPRINPELAQTRISCLWNQPEAALNYQAAVSLHSHTNQSKESLGFIQEFAEKSPLLNWALKRQYKRSRFPVDLTTAYWTPPLTPELALKTETDQIENRLGLLGLVAITDHDNIAAPLRLRELDGNREIPIALEWSVPFENAIFHLGIHNLPASRARRIASDLFAYTSAPSERALGGLLEMLDDMPEVLVIFNHPLWDLYRMGEQKFLLVVDRFLERYVRYLHAFELNATRSCKENHGVIALSDRWQRLLISGGDRHGCEPSGALNLTRAQSFSEFADEVRGQQRSHVLFMPQYSESLTLRTIQTLLDVIREYPEFEAESRYWDNRVFYPDHLADNLDRPVSYYWKGPPAFLKRIFSIIRLLENPVTRRAVARVLPGKADLGLTSDVVEVFPEAVVYEATL